MTSLRDGGGVTLPRSEAGDADQTGARKGRTKPGQGASEAKAAGTKPNDGKDDRSAAKRARIKRRHRSARSQADPADVPAAPEGSLLTTSQMREARKIMREKQAISRKEREFGRRLVTTLTEGQNALNIAFGAILSAYIGTMLAAIDDRPFDPWTLAGFFVLIGTFIGGLCIGNLVVLRKHFGLGLGFLATGAAAAALSLDAARALGFELPILKVMFICWYAMLVATDGLLTAIVFFHHQTVVRREAQLDQARAL